MLVFFTAKLHVVNFHSFFNFLISSGIALKSREQRTSSPPCARSVEYFLHPVTVQSIVPPRRKNNKHTQDSFRGECPMIVPSFFNSHSILIGSVFRLSFSDQCLSNHHRPYFFINVVTSNITVPFKKLFHGSYPPSSRLNALPLLVYRLHMSVPSESRLRNMQCCKIFVPNIFVGCWPSKKFQYENFIQWKFSNLQNMLEKMYL